MLFASSYVVHLKKRSKANTFFSHKMMSCNSSKSFLRQLVNVVSVEVSLTAWQRLIMAWIPMFSVLCPQRTSDSHKYLLMTVNFLSRCSVWKGGPLRVIWHLNSPVVFKSTSCKTSWCKPVLTICKKKKDTFSTDILNIPNQRRCRVPLLFRMVHNLYKFDGA